MPRRPSATSPRRRRNCAEAPESAGVACSDSRLLSSCGAGQQAKRCMSVGKAVAGPRYFEQRFHRRRLALGCLGAPAVPETSKPLTRYDDPKGKVCDRSRVIERRRLCSKALSTTRSPGCSVSPYRRQCSPRRRGNRVTGQGEHPRPLRGTNIASMDCVSNAFE
jgi:hypothetical protein